MFLDQNVEAFPVGRFGRLLELLAAAELAHLQLAVGGVEGLDDFEAVVRTPVTTTEIFGAGKSQSDDVRCLPFDDWRVVGLVEDVPF